MRPGRLILPFLLLALAAPAPAQQAVRKYLSPTHVYLKADSLDLAALPEPPKPGSLAAEGDLETILQLQAWRTEAQAAWAKQADQFDPFDLQEPLGPWFKRKDLPQCARLLDEVLGDGEAANHAAKLRFKRLRPPFQDSRVQPSLPLMAPRSGAPPAGYYSYPSGHATSMYLLAEVVADLMPDRAAAARDWAAHAAWSRMIAGVHFPSDNVGGRFLAHIVAGALRKEPAYQAALARCKEEIRPFLTAR
jgi:hypothetical protein